MNCRTLFQICILVLGLSNKAQAGGIEHCLYSFAKTESLRPFSKTLYATVVQRMVDTGYGKSFKFLGDEEDFDHCHFMFSPQERHQALPAESPFAALCHTQEEAYDWHRISPGSKYDYVDRNARNWIVFLDSLRVENANAYKVSPLDPKFRIFDQHHTINPTSDFLDSKKLGTQIHSNIQFRFSRTHCSSIPDAMLDKSSVFKVTLPDGSEACLELWDEDGCSGRKSSSASCQKKCLDSGVRIKTYVSGFEEER